MSWVSFYIASRYFLSRKNPQAVNIISWIAISSLASGTIALSVLLAVFSGLETLNKSLYQKIDPDIKIQPKNGKYFSITPLLIHSIKNIKGVEAVSQTAEEKVYLRYRNYNHLAYLKGVDLDYDKVMSFKKILLSGDPSSLYLSRTLWVGLGVAKRLSLIIKDYENPIHILAPKSDEVFTNKISFHEKKTTATGVFHILEDIDEKYAYTSLEFVQELFGKKNLVCSLEIKTIPKYTLNKIKKDLSTLLGNTFSVKTRQEQEEALFKIINIENFILYLFLCLVLIITSFSLVGAIVILILDKKEQIYTFQSIGMSMKQIKNVFFYLGGFITLSGWLIGIFTGYGLGLAQKKFSWITVNKGIAFPVKFTLNNFILINFTVWLIGLTGAYYSSRKLRNSK